MVYHGEFSIEQVLFSEVGEVRINGADAFNTALLPTLTTSAQMTRSAWGRNKSVPGVRIRSAQFSSNLHLQFRCQDRVSSQQSHFFSFSKLDIFSFIELG